MTTSVPYAHTTNGETVHWPLRNDARSLNGIVTGGIAAGKTETLYRLAVQAASNGYRVVHADAWDLGGPMWNSVETLPLSRFLTDLAKPQKTPVVALVEEIDWVPDPPWTPGPGQHPGAVRGKVHPEPAAPTRRPRPGHRP